MIGSSTQRMKVNVPIPRRSPLSKSLAIRTGRGTHARNDAVRPIAGTLPLSLRPHFAPIPQDQVPAVILFKVSKLNRIRIYDTLYSIKYV